MYINRKVFPSVQLQVVSDSNLRFLDVYTGWPGACHDARVFRNSPLRSILELNTIPTTYYLLGDSAYPLTNSLLVPFRDNSFLTPLQKKYNNIHAAARVDVERAIGLLKSKWRRLHYLEMHGITKIVDVIMSICVLHNFVLTMESYEESEIAEYENESDDSSEVERHSAMTSADNKRRDIANILFQRQ